MSKSNAKIAIKKIKNLSIGDKFQTTDGETKGVLVEKTVGQCKILITKRKKSPEFYKSDGEPDPYWFGFQYWALDTEVLII